jgi:hypothetical protein
MTTFTLEQLRDRINDYVTRRTYIKDSLSKQLTSVQLNAEIQNLEQQLEGIEGQTADFEGQVKDVMELSVDLDFGIPNSCISFFPDPAASKDYFHTLNKGERIRVRGRITHFRPQRKEYALLTEGTFLVCISAAPAPIVEEKAAPAPIVQEKSSGCFVATAAYGSPSSTVFLLQEYRDRILNKAIVGRAAVRFYYLVSPPLARFIEASNRRRLIARMFLGPFVFLARQKLELLQMLDRRR